MREVEDVLKEISDKRAELKQIEEQRLTALNSPGNPAMKDELDKIYQKHIATARGQVDSLVAELVRWPPHKIEHFAKLKQFWALNPYDKAVFIMTKYPDNKTALDQELQNESIPCGKKFSGADSLRFWHPIRNTIPNFSRMSSCT